jgi:hypothetical protein
MHIHALEIEKFVMGLRHGPPKGGKGEEAGEKERIREEGMRKGKSRWQTERDRLHRNRRRVEEEGMDGKWRNGGMGRVEKGKGTEIVVIRVWGVVPLFFRSYLRPC